jgi:hypothetical protein
MMLGVDGVLYYAGYVQNIGEFDPKYHTIDYVYGMIDFDDDDQFEALEVEHSKRYPPDEGIKDVYTGWISPDGRFFPCEWREHDSMAYYIYRYLNGCNPDGPAQLEKENWIRVNPGCIRYRFDYDEFTWQQLATLSEIYVKTDNEQFKGLYSWILEEIEEKKDNGIL